MWTSSFCWSLLANSGSLPITVAFFHDWLFSFKVWKRAYLCSEVSASCQGIAFQRTLRCPKQLMWKVPVTASILSIVKTTLKKCQEFKITLRTFSCSHMVVFACLYHKELFWSLICILHPNYQNKIFEELETSIIIVNLNPFFFWGKTRSLY